MPSSASHTGSTDPTTSTLSARDIALVVVATLVCALVLRMFVVEAYRIPSASMENTLLTGDLILVNKVSYGIRVPSTIPFFPIPLDPGYLLSLSNIRRGDVIVFELPGVVDNGNPATEAAFVKRCVGIPGDTVEVRQARVLVNHREMIPPPTVRMQAYEHASFSSRLFPPGAGFTEREYGPLRVPMRGDRIDVRVNTLPEWQRLMEREGHRVDVSDNVVLVDGIARESYTIEKNYYFVLGDNMGNSTDSRVWGFVCEDDIVGEALLVYWSSAPEHDYTGRTQPFQNVRWSRVGSLVQ